MYFIAGIRRALSTIEHDPAMFDQIATAMERHASDVPEPHRVSLETAARWMRHLENAVDADTDTPGRLASAE